MRKFICAVAILFGSSSLLNCQTGRHRALIVVNGEYKYFEKLSSSSVKDGEAMLDALTTIGFVRNDITVLSDLTSKTFLTEIHSFASQLSSEDSVVFYYSGHGFSFDGVDYLAPVDFPINHASKKSLNQAVNLHAVLSLLDVAQSRVVILDACRNQLPLLKGLTKVNSEERIDTLGPLPTNGAIVAFSSRQGEPSRARAEGGMSLYTYYLTNNLRSHPSEITEVFRKTAVDVARASDEKQHPAYYDEMEGAFALGGKQTIYLPSSSLVVTQRSAHAELRDVTNKLSGMSIDWNNELGGLMMQRGQALESISGQTNSNDAETKKKRDEIERNFEAEVDRLDGKYVYEFSFLSSAISNAHSHAIERMQTAIPPAYTPNEVAADQKEFDDDVAEAIKPMGFTREATQPIEGRFSKLERYLYKLITKMGDYRELPLNQ